MTIYRVHYLGLTTDLKRDFTDEGEATRFFNIRRDAAGTMWRHIRLEKITPRQ